MIWETLLAILSVCLIFATIIFMVLSNKFDDRYLKIPKTENSKFIEKEICDTKMSDYKIQCNQKHMTEDVIISSLRQDVQRIDKALVDGFDKVFVKVDNLADILMRIK